MESVTINKVDHLDFYRSEAYKTLRTNIQFSGDDIKAIALTSCTSGEGKSTISFNIAIDMARSGKRVIYIDTDLRRTVLVNRYHIRGATYGLTHYLTNQCTINDCIYATNIPNLHIIVAGPVPPNPTELLDNKYFKQMILALRRVFDYIIIDTPPLGSVIDSAIVAKECDGAILVVKSNTVDYRFAAKVKEQLEMSGCRILGAILTMVPIKNNSYYSKYYSSYFQEDYLADSSKKGKRRKIKKMK